jgi:hypothetical protein
MLIAWLVALAGAQTPPPAAPPAAPAERWLSAEVVSERFPGEATPGPKFSAGEEVTVLVEDGAKTRVFAGDRYGWVPSASLTATAPAEPAAPPGASGLLGGLPPLIQPPPKP